MRLANAFLEDIVFLGMKQDSFLVFVRNQKIPAEAVSYQQSAVSKNKIYSPVRG
jgi:hypothetical protein